MLPRTQEGIAIFIVYIVLCTCVPSRNLPGTPRRTAHQEASGKELLPSCHGPCPPFNWHPLRSLLPKTTGFHTSKLRLSKKSADLSVCWLSYEKTLGAIPDYPTPWPWKRLTSHSYVEGGWHLWYAKSTTFILVSCEKAQKMLLLISTYEPRKKNSCFPFYWLLKRDHYNVRLYHISWWYHTLYNRTNHVFHCSYIHTYIHTYMHTCIYICIYTSKTSSADTKRYSFTSEKSHSKMTHSSYNWNCSKGTPLIFKIDTQKKVWLKGYTFPKKTFLVSMLNFGVVHVLFLWGSVACTSRQYKKTSSKVQSKMKNSSWSRCYTLNLAQGGPRADGCKWSHPCKWPKIHGLLVVHNPTNLRGGGTKASRRCRSSVPFFSHVCMASSGVFRNVLQQSVCERKWTGKQIEEVKVGSEYHTWK